MPTTHIARDVQYDLCWHENGYLVALTCSVPYITPLLHWLLTFVYIEMAESDAMEKLKEEIDTYLKERSSALHFLLESEDAATRAGVERILGSSNLSDEQSVSGGTSPNAGSDDSGMQGIRDYSSLTAVSDQGTLPLDAIDPQLTKRSSEDADHLVPTASEKTIS